jgi:hypothetical protein
LQAAQQGGTLHMDMQPDEDDFMMEVGALNSCCPDLRGAEIALSPRVSSHAAAESVKMLFIFQHLRHLQLRSAAAPAAAAAAASELCTCFQLPNLVACFTSPHTVLCCQ